MGKSSLGKRKTSVCPVRLSSLSAVPEQSARQSRGTAKTSLIPRPSRNRTQSSSPTRDAPKPIHPASLRRSRSNSNLQNAGTPMTPMCWLGSIPGTAQSSKCSVFDSKGQGRSFKPVLKDSRPLSDRQFQNAAVQRVLNYLKETYDGDFMQNASNALSRRSLTLKLFVDLMSRLLTQFFVKYIINMSNYADEIPLLTKKLGYPASVKKSWLITANSSHSWPNVIGLLSWMVCVVRCVTHEELMKIMFGHEEDEEMPENIVGSQVMCSYYFKCYDFFNKEEGERMAAEDDLLSLEMEKKCHINVEDKIAIKDTIKKLKIQAEDEFPEEERVHAQLMEQEKAVTIFQHDLKKLDDCIQKKYTYLDKLQDNRGKRSLKQTGLRESYERVKSDILKMKDTVHNQSFTLEDKKRTETECRELEESINMDHMYCDSYLKAVYADDLQIARMINETKSRNVAYSASIINYSDMFPDLNILNMPVNILHRDADQTMQDILDQMDSMMTELKTRLKELETQLEEDEEAKRKSAECKFVDTEEINSTVRMVEDLGTEIANMKENTSQEKQKMKHSLKRVQDECASRAEMSSYLQEEKCKLKEGEKVTLLIKAHIVDVTEQMKAFFAELDAMFKNVIQVMINSIQSLEHGPEN